MNVRGFYKHLRTYLNSLNMKQPIDIKILTEKDLREHALAKSVKDMRWSYFIDEYNTAHYDCIVFTRGMEYKVLYRSLTVPVHDLDIKVSLRKHQKEIDNKKYIESLNKEQVLQKAKDLLTRLTK